MPAFGDPDAWLAIVGMAPGKGGANRTGRPFTGDGAGPLLYDTLGAVGLASGTYAGTPGDGVTLTGAIILNAVKCLPPENKPTPEEVRTCRAYLEDEVATLPHARVFVGLGAVAHQAIVKTLGGKLPKCPFGHGAQHRMPDGRIVLDSYHPSRYNQNTGRLTPAMFADIFARAVTLQPGSAARNG